MAATCVDRVAANIQLNIEDSLENVLLDSGSPVSFISFGCFKNLQYKSKRSLTVSNTCKNSWISVNGSRFSADKVVYLEIITNSVRRLCPFYIIESSVPCIIGRDNLQTLKCIMDFSKKENVFSFVGMSAEMDKNSFFEMFSLPITWSKSELSKLEDILWKYRNIFSLNKTDFGRTDLVQHVIQTNDCDPICIRPYRRSLKEEEEIMEEVKSMLEAGVIERSSSPWCFPTIRVSKKDGSKKLAIDFRKLNQVTKNDRFPLPHVDSLLDRVSAAKVFTTLDIASAYWNIPLENSSKEKTAFQAGNELFQFTVLPYGLSAAPATMQRLLQRLIGDLNLVPYLDDIIVPTDSVSQHINLLESLFQRLEKAKLKLKPSKCFFGQEAVEYLGYVVSEGKITSNPQKIEAIKNFEIPKTQKSLQRFLGMCQFYSRFIPNFSEMANSLFEIQNCTRNKYHWSEECSKAFSDIKEAFSNIISLSQPDFNYPLKIDIDASSHSIGAVIYQDKKPPIAFASRKLSKAERNYSTTDREFLALVWAIKHFRPYVYGYEFEVFTDHKPLIHMRKSKPNNGRQARWQMFLEEYKFSLAFKNGSVNVVADYLSRYDEVDSENNEESEQVANLISVEETSWKTEQREDEFCLSIIEKLSKKQCHSGYLLDEDEVLRYYGRIVLPEKCVPKYVDIFHSQGHFSAANVRSSILGAGYWFPKIRTRIKELTANCIPCSRKSYSSFRSPFIPLPKAPEILPFQLVAVDIVGPLPVAQSGYQYVLTMTDHATRWFEAVPLTNIRMETCANAFLENWIYRYGPPAQLHSDRGTQFLSQVFVNVLRRFGISNSKTTPYHPQGNSIIERLHRTFKDRLRSHSSNWLLNLQESVYNINRNSHNNGPSAFELLFQRSGFAPKDWPSEKRFKDSFLIRDGPAVGSRVAVRNFTKKSLEPCFLGDFEVISRPTNVTAKLSNNSIVNIRNLRQI